MFRKAVADGAVPIFTPCLIAAQQAEVRCLKFGEAVDGRLGGGARRSGLSDRARVFITNDGTDAPSAEPDVSDPKAIAAE